MRHASRPFTEPTSYNQDCRYPPRVHVKGFLSEPDLALAGGPGVHFLVVRPIGLLAAILWAPFASAGIEVRVSQGGGLAVRAAGAPLCDVVDRIARVTGMRVEYEGPPPRTPVTLSLDRPSAAEAVMLVLEGLGLNYALTMQAEGRQVRSLFVFSSAPTPPRSSPTGPAPPAPASVDEETAGGRAEGPAPPADAGEDARPAEDDAPPPPPGEAVAAMEAARDTAAPALREALQEALEAARHLVQRHDALGREIAALSAKSEPAEVASLERQLAALGPENPGEGEAWRSLRSQTRRQLEIHEEVARRREATVRMRDRVAATIHRLSRAVEALEAGSAAAVRQMCREAEDLLRSETLEELVRQGRP
jgi:hypothetical protein